MQSIAPVLSSTILVHIAERGAYMALVRVSFFCLVSSSPRRALIIYKYKRGVDRFAATSKSDSCLLLQLSPPGVCWTAAAFFFLMMMPVLHFFPSFFFSHDFHLMFEQSMLIPSTTTAATVCVCLIPAAVGRYPTIPFIQMMKHHQAAAAVMLISISSTDAVTALCCSRPRA